MKDKEIREKVEDLKEMIIKNGYVSRAEKEYFFEKIDKIFGDLEWKIIKKKYVK